VAALANFAWFWDQDANNLWIVSVARPLRRTS
jgi:hypothetical protein